MNESAVADDVTKEEEQAVHGWDFVRLILAWGLTAGALPLGVGICLVYLVLENRLPPALYWFVPAVLAVMGLTWGLGSHPSIRPWNKLILLGVMTTWFIATASFAYPMTSAPQQHGWIIALYAAATLWMPWFAWFGFWPDSFFSRFCVLVVLVAGLVVFHQFIYVEGLSGDAIVNVNWRSHGGPSLATSIEGEAKPTIDLKATPYDFPQFLGPNRDLHLRSVDLDTDWANHPPEKKWLQPIGLGWGAMAIVGDVAFTQEQRESDECVVCYELRTGKILWIHADDTAFLSTFGGNGPRATPTVDEGKVYTVGATGIVQCLDGQTGSVIWKTDILPENKDNLMHGVCGSPLIVGDLLYVCPVIKTSESLRAYNKKTGEVVFNAGGGRAAYSSPMLVEIGGTPQVLAYNAQNLVSYDPKSGKILWHHPWENNQGVNASQPVLYRDDKENVFLSTSYDKGATLISVRHGDKDDWKVEERWTTRKMKNKFTTSVVIDDFIVGLDDGILAALDLKSGKPLWKSGRYGHGQILLVGKHLLVLTESGDLVLLEPTAKGGKEIAKLPEAIEGKTWNNLAFSPPYLLIRNSDEAACYRLPIAGESERKSAEPIHEKEPEKKADKPAHVVEIPKETKKSKPTAEKPAPVKKVDNDPIPFEADQPKFPDITPPTEEPKPAAVMPPAPPTIPPADSPKPEDDAPKPGEQPPPVEVPSLDLPPIGLPPAEKP
ncbi:PQQ-binding-like beta-propeller repeat protein [bacterium]|nr:PQQ-binding-like beta-propeller repeat protein [bacterium]